MDEADVVRIKDQLDAELQSAGPNVGIAFGIELFEEFDERRWLTLETFGASALFPARMPAYARTHCALRTWDLANREFRVGRDKNVAGTVAASWLSLARQDEAMDGGLATWGTANSPDSEQHRTRG